MLLPGSLLSNKVAGGGGGVSMYVEDTFTDTNGTELENHTPDIDVVGGGWNALGTSSRFFIQDNDAEVTYSLTASDCCAIDCGQSDYICEYTVRTNFQGADRSRTAVRITDINDNWIVYADSTSVLHLYENIAGSLTSRASQGSLSIIDGHVIKIRCEGSTIQVYDDADVDFEYNSATSGQSSTLVGMSAGKATRDNFKVYPIP